MVQSAVPFHRIFARKSFIFGHFLQEIRQVLQERTANMMSDLSKRASAHRSRKGPLSSPGKNSAGADVVQRGPLKTVVLISTKCNL